MTKNVVYFTPDITDTSTITRGEALRDQGCELTVVGFRRDRYNPTFQPPWPCITLGRTQDGRYTRRLFALIAALPIIMAHRGKLKDADIFYARNIDQLLLALFAQVLIRRRVPLIYEVLDIQPIFMGSGLASRLIRAAERYGLRHIGLLVVSSPAFYRHYFNAIQGYKRAWYLLENKLPPSIRQLPNARPRQDFPGGRKNGYRWVVAYCGLIRGHETVDLIIRLAERLKGIVLFKFHGVTTTVDRAYFDAAVAGLDNVVYEGSYLNPQDLPRIYGEVDFAWALDLENAEHNSRWLLPCRFYEAGFFGVPCLAADGFEVGDLVEKLGVGWSFSAPYLESMTNFFLNLTPAQYEERRGRLLSQPVDRFVAVDDTAALLDALDGAIGSVETSGSTIAHVGPARMANEPLKRTSSSKLD